MTDHWGYAGHLSASEVCGRDHWREERYRQGQLRPRHVIKESLRAELAPCSRWRKFHSSAWSSTENLRAVLLRTSVESSEAASKRLTPQRDGRAEMKIESLREKKEALERSDPVQRHLRVFPKSVDVPDELIGVHFEFNRLPSCKQVLRS